MSEVALSCCGDTPPPNPKEWRKGKSREGFTLFSAKNPIPDQIQDDDELTGLWNKWGLIPFAGTSQRSGDSLLALYLLYYKLSPTHRAAIEKKTKYAVGGKVKVVRTEDNVWSIPGDTVEVSAAEIVRYRDTFNEYVNVKGGIQKMCKSIANSIQATGNAFVKMKFAVEDGVGRISLKFLPTTHCKYAELKRADSEIDVIAVSPVWTEQYLTKHGGPDYIAKYPEFSQDDEGYIETIFHLKVGEGKWYGRPENEGSDLQKYSEVQNGIYLVRQAAANYVGQLIIEVEDVDLDEEEGKAKESGFDSFVDRFEKNHTNKGDDPQAVTIASRPYGSRPMFVFQVQPNTNENWFKTIGEINRETIVRSHECTMRFMAFDVAGGFSNDVFLSDYLINMKPVIEDLRVTVMSFTNGIINAAWDLLGMQDMKQYSIDFGAPIEEAIAEYKNRNQNQNIAANGNTAV